MPNTDTDIVLITGKTYPVRAKLHDLGGTWSKVDNGWLVPADRAEEALEAVRAGVAPKGRTGGIVVTRFHGGGTIFRNARGRCIDAPCCSCCS